MQTFKKQSQSKSLKSTQSTELTEVKVDGLVLARLQARRKAFMLQDMEVQDE